MSDAALLTAILATPLVGAIAIALSSRHPNVREAATLAAAGTTFALVLALLAIRAEPGSDGAATLELDFSGGAAIRLNVECIDAVLTDIGESWDALARPHHDEA